MKIGLYFQLIVTAIFLVNNVYPNAVVLNGANFDSIVGGSELVFINFYAGWCRFSNMLEPIWDNFAQRIHKNYDGRKVMVAKVDADSEKIIAANNGINKYPTLKIYRYGVLVKKEYRGARTADAFEAYIKEQVISKLKIVESVPDFMASQDGKPTIVGYFESKQSENYKTFEKLANILRDRCEFIATVGEAFQNERKHGDRIMYKADGTNDIDNKNHFGGQLTNYNELYAWAYERCTPTVRKITFENAEELTEGGLPFLIIFHKPDDTEAIRIFENEVKRQLGHGQINTVLPVAADGQMFSHPLNHLGKSMSDLPLVAIDSFKHMYVFPSNKKYTDGENLKQFVDDLSSGKLHREFHNGPDAGGLEMLPNVQFEIVLNQGDHVPKIPAQKQVEVKTAPPESTFVKLAPSQDRYSVRHGDGGEF